MSKSPTFSVLMPAYNASEFIGEAIESIRKQSIDDWELIVADDCSTDDTALTVASYADIDSRIKLHRLEENSGGVFVPRYKAALIAKGKYMVMLDADDVVDSDLLQIHLEAITTRGADLVIPEMWRFDRSLEDAWRRLPLPGKEIVKATDGKTLVDLTLLRWEIPMAGYAMPTSSFLEACEMTRASSHDYVKYADEATSRFILYLSKAVVSSSSRYFYRNNPLSVTHRQTDEFDRSLSVNKLLIDFTANIYGHDSKEYIHARMRQFLCRVDMLRACNTSKLTSSEKKEIIKKVIDNENKDDFTFLRKHMSPRYLALMRLPVPLARVVLKVVDSLLLRLRKNK